MSSDWNKRMPAYIEVEKILYSYYYASKRVEKLEERYKRLKEELEKRGSLTAITFSQMKVKSASIIDSIPKYIVDKFTRLQRTERKLREYKLQQLAVEKFVNELKYDRGRNIIKDRYFFKKTSVSIGKEQGVHGNMITNIKTRELYKLIDIYLERGDEFGFW